MNEKVNPKKMMRTFKFGAIALAVLMLLEGVNQLTANADQLDSGNFCIQASSDTGEFKSKPVGNCVTQQEREPVGYTQDSHALGFSELAAGSDYSVSVHRPTGEVLHQSNGTVGAGGNVYSYFDAENPAFEASPDGGFIGFAPSLIVTLTSEGSIYTYTFDADAASVSRQDVQGDGLTWLYIYPVLELTADGLVDPWGE